MPMSAPTPRSAAEPGAGIANALKVTCPGDVPERIESAPPEVMTLNEGEVHVPNCAAPELPVGPLLCTLDGSPFAEAILPHATTFAQVAGLTMTLLSVAVPHAMPMAPFGAEALLADDSAMALEEAGYREYLTRIASACIALRASLQAASQSRGKALTRLCTCECSTTSNQRIERSALACLFNQLFFTSKTLGLALHYSCALSTDDSAFFSCDHTL